MLKKISLTASIVVSSMLSQANAAQWHMPTPYGDANYPTQISYQFAKEVKEKTNGELDIVVHSGASLVRHPEIPRAVKTGQVQLGEILMGIMGNTHPIFKHDNIPFLATDYDSAAKLWEAVKPELKKQLDREGMMLLYVTVWPAQSLYTKKEVNQLSDLDGARMRSYSPSISRLAALMGLTPTTIQVPEIPQAFSTGIVDAMVSSPLTGVTSQAWDYVSHYTDIQAWIPKNMVVINKRAFKRLDKATQKAILEAAANAEKKGWQMVREEAKKSTDTLGEHMVVSKPSAKLTAEFNAIGETMIQEWAQEAPELNAVLENYRK